jgi:hypothetical protein
LIGRFFGAAIADDFGGHSSFYHAEEEGLDDSIEFVVLVWRVGSFDVCEDCLADEGAESGGGR